MFISQVAVVEVKEIMRIHIMKDEPVCQSPDSWYLVSDTPKTPDIKHHKSDSLSPEGLQLLSA